MNNILCVREENWNYYVIILWHPWPAITAATLRSPAINYESSWGFEWILIKTFFTLNVFFSFFSTVPFYFCWVNKHQTITIWGVWENYLFEVVHRNQRGGHFGKLWHVVKPWDLITLQAGQSGSLLAGSCFSWRGHCSQAASWHF